MKGRAITALSVSGLFVAAAAWAAHQQIGYIAASFLCSGTATFFWVVTFVAVLLLLAGLAAALLSARGRGEDGPRRFLLSISVLASALFLFAILLQATALWFLPGCAG